MNTVKLKVASIFWFLALWGSAHLQAVAATPQWASVGLYDQGAVSVDIANVSREGPLRRLWSMMDYKMAQKSESGDTFLSTRSQMEINCQTRQVRILHLSMHAAARLGGRVVDSEGILREWQAIPPGTPVDRISARVC
jgi:hypothetical protein